MLHSILLDYPVVKIMLFWHQVTRRRLIGQARGVLKARWLSAHRDFNTYLIRFNNRFVFGGAVECCRNHYFRSEDYIANVRINFDRQMQATLLGVGNELMLHLDGTLPVIETLFARLVREQATVTLPSDNIKTHGPF